MSEHLWRSGRGRLRAFTLFEGVLMLALGVLALLFPLMASRSVTAVVAVAFLVGGIVGWINNLLRARLLARWLVFWRLVVSTLFLVVGITMLEQLGGGPPTAALPVVNLALAIGIVFLLEGLVALSVALTHRHLRGWSWGVLNGLVTLLLGGLIVSMPESALRSVMGILVGISFVFSGTDLLIFSARFHDEP